MRDRYGRHTFGQSLLLARRLVEAGVPVVQVNMGRVQTWDTHSDNFKSLEGPAAAAARPRASRPCSTTCGRGLLDETLVVVTGEFGRTPRIGASTGNNNSPDGRDHWSAVFSARLRRRRASAAARSIGQSDRIGAYPASRPYTPADLAATVYTALGIDPRDRAARPPRGGPSACASASRSRPCSLARPFRHLHPGLPIPGSRVIFVQ